MQVFRQHNGDYAKQLDSTDGKTIGKRLQEIAGKTWKKEDELKLLKSGLATLDRKIQLELAPSGENVPTERMIRER